MGYSVTELTEEATEWNQYVETSPHTGPLHRFGALGTLSDETGMGLHTLVCYKGEGPIGVLPLFTVSRPAFEAVLSRPLPLGISRDSPSPELRPSG